MAVGTIENNGAEVALAGSHVPQASKTVRDYVVDIGCWMIDAVVNTITFIIGGAILIVGGIVVSIVEFVVKLVLGLAMLWVSCWVIGALLKLCWMIWGPKNL